MRCKLTRTCCMLCLTSLIVLGLFVLPAAARYSIADIVDVVSPSVVSVHTTGERLVGRHLMPQEGVGSGVIVTAEGLIMTNYHVIADAVQLTVGMSDGTVFDDVDVVGTDPFSDLAILQILSLDGHTLRPAELGDSDAARVGETVLAFGNPFAFQLGSQLTVTKGIISAKNRIIETDAAVFQDFLQTDAAINPGNSGGPLVTIDGRVVGINTAIIPFAQGIGFAIPINTATEIMAQLLQEGAVVRPWLGAIVEAHPDGGVQVRRVEAGSDAERAGLRVGDVVREVNRTPVETTRDMFTAIQALEVGETVFIVVIRQGARHYLVTQIEQRP